MPLSVCLSVCLVRHACPQIHQMIHPATHDLSMSLHSFLIAIVSRMLINVLVSLKAEGQTTNSITLQRIEQREVRHISSHQYLLYYIGPMHSFIHYGDLYSAPSRLLLRSAPDPCTTKKKSFETRVECVLRRHRRALKSPRCVWDSVLFLL